jgi:hypothetical protein
MISRVRVLHHDITSLHDNINKILNIESIFVIVYEL